MGLVVPCVLCGPLEESVPGVPGADYPVLSSPPQTSFSCTGKSDGGYYADREARCQGQILSTTTRLDVHRCDRNMPTLKKLPYFSYEQDQILFSGHRFTQ